jgi:hypothetical protein
MSMLSLPSQKQLSVIVVVLFSRRFCPHLGTFIHLWWRPLPRHREGVFFIVLSKFTG